MADNNMELTPDDMLNVGLHLLGESERQRQSSSLDTRVQRFKDCFGSHPQVYAAVWNDLRHVKGCKVSRFFLFLYWLKACALEGDNATRFDLSEVSVRENYYKYLEYFQILKAQKVSHQMHFIVNGKYHTDLTPSLFRLKRLLQTSSLLVLLHVVALMASTSKRSNWRIQISPLTRRFCPTN